MLGLSLGLLTCGDATLRHLPEEQTSRPSESRPTLPTPIEPDTSTSLQEENAVSRDTSSIKIDSPPPAQVLPGELPTPPTQPDTATLRAQCEELARPTDIGECVRCLRTCGAEAHWVSDASPHCAIGHQTVDSANDCSTTTAPTGTVEPPADCRAGYSYPEQGVEAWRPLVEKYFKAEDVAWALAIIRCESGGDPQAVNASSGASGLFQWMPQYWDHYSTTAGFAGSDPLCPEPNIATSAYLLNKEGPHGWACNAPEYIGALSR
ncbi:MAG: hypothetical protein A2284_17330 [Deltaproteobacteria bacterium RIFOXYA12_FULL_61_11]|nr:MAG: hypothetical protein A2284_17330 [Deltaproteobacteria bacterium RIFOXYA12_FULL_61_11]